MHLAIDLSESEHQPTGVGTFATSLVDCWRGAVQAGELHLTACVRDASGLPEAWQASGIRIAAAGRAQSHPILWQQTTLRSLVRRLQPDCFFGPAYGLPHGLSVPAAVALHDLSFERFPSAWHWRERWRRRWLARSAARRAARIITISHFSAQELEQLYGVSPAKIDIVPLGVRADLRPAGAPQREALRRDLGLDPAVPVVLHVGTLLARRNVPRLAHAVASLARPAQLVVIGHNRARPALDLQQLARETGLAGRLVYRPYVAASALAALYSLADVYVSLSNYEGFGLPVLEAIACGTPAVVLSVGASQELWREHAHMLGSTELGDVVAALDAVLENPALGLRQRAQLLEHYTWKRCAEKILGALREIAH